MYLDKMGEINAMPEKYIYELSGFVKNSNQT